MSSPTDRLGLDFNVVAFRYGPADQVALAHVPARANDGISQAWQNVLGQHRILSNQIVEVHAEWEPTAADYEFIGENFPHLPRVTFNFERPESGDWDAALRQAAAIRAAAMDKMHAQQATANPGAPLTDPEAPEPLAIPMLRMVTSPPPLSAYRTLLPNQLYVLVARAAPTPHGTLALNWVLQNQLAVTGVAFDDLLDEAFANLAAGLTTTGYSLGDGSGTDILEITGHDTVHPTAAAIAMPNFREQIASILGGDRFLVAISCHERLQVARADSEVGTTALKEMVFAHEQQQEGVVPTLLLIEPHGMRIVAQNGEPPG
jgi:hypothetical protein